MVLLRERKSKEAEKEVVTVKPVAKATKKAKAAKTEKPPKKEKVAKKPKAAKKISKKAAAPAADRAAAPAAEPAPSIVPLPAEPAMETEEPAAEPAEATTFVSDDPDAVLAKFLSGKAAEHEAKHADIKELDALIRAKAPSLKPELQGKGSIAYGGFDYQTKSKCKGRWARVGIMVNKTGLSLMIVGNKDGKYLLEHYPKKHFGQATLGKSCIRFTKLSKLNLESIGQLVEEAATADISSFQQGVPAA
eukprot:scaffold3955_cov160-Cylindrotheca_fusiformis.AAC.9